MSRYDLHIEDGLKNDDSSLVLLRFSSMRSQFDNPADQIHLSIKPKSSKLKLELTLDPNSSSFCQEKAYALASKSVPKTFQAGQVNKNFYTSTKVPVEDSQLFACKVVNNKLVCQPITSIFTMRSDLSHLDLKDEVDPKEEVRPISVKFAGPDRQNSASKSTDNQHENDDSADEYQRLNYKHLSSRESLLQRVTLYGKKLPEVKVDPDAEPIDKKPPVVYMPDIKPKIEKKVFDDIYSAEKTTHQSSPQKANKIKQIVKECLLVVKIASFEEIYRYLGDRVGDKNQINNKDILDALNDLAVLVQGNWIIKSEILYGDSSERDSTDVSGVSISLFIAARDYLMWLFTQQQLVSRVEYTERVRLPDCDVLELFNQFATLKKDIKRWELKLPKDDRFLEKFPDVVNRQTTFWKVRRANKLSVFNA